MGINILDRARAVKNDEFYTRYEDIEAELKHYNFRHKVIYCNCDDYYTSNFVKYFIDNFKQLGLKGLIASGFSANGLAEILTYDGTDMYHTQDSDNGDFREHKDLLNMADVVVTNPPFSLFREYSEFLRTCGREFLIIAPITVVTYRETFPLFQRGAWRVGYTTPNRFTGPDGNNVHMGNVMWITNAPVGGKTLSLTKQYRGHEAEYPKYDGYDAINVDRLKDIPADYDGVMGVPITIIQHFDPDQFEILAHVLLTIDGNPKFRRILIRKRIRTGGGENESL